MNYKLYLIKQALLSNAQLIATVLGTGALSGGLYAGLTTKAEDKEKLKAILIGAGLGIPLAAGGAVLGGLVGGSAAKWLPDRRSRSERHFAPALQQAEFEMDAVGGAVLGGLAGGSVARWGV
jgi:Na+/glutamate symporter